MMGSGNYATSEIKEKWFGDCQKKKWVFIKYILNMIQSCFMKIHHIDRFSSRLFVFLSTYLVCIGFICQCCLSLKPFCIWHHWPIIYLLISYILCLLTCYQLYNQLYSVFPQPNLLVQSLSCVRLYDPMTVAHQTPLGMGFSRQEYWSEVPFPSSQPGDRTHISWGSCLSKRILHHRATWEAQC